MERGRARELLQSARAVSLPAPIQERSALVLAQEVRIEEVLALSHAPYASEFAHTQPQRIRHENPLQSLVTNEAALSFPTLML